MSSVQAAIPPVASSTVKLPGIETTQKSLLIIFAVSAMLVLVLVVLYIAAKIKKNKLDGVDMADRIIKLDDRATVPFKITADSISLPSVGQEFTYTFWLYINQYSATTEHKLLFQRGNTIENRDRFNFSTNPIVFLDKNTNKLYVALSTSLIRSEYTYDEILKTTSEGKFNSGYMIAYVDYVPLQRWVNITFFLKDDKLLMFMDGDLYTAVSLNDVSKPGETLRPLIRDTMGAATVGDARTDGYLSYLRYFNYALTQKEIKAIYERGPVKKSILSLIGLQKYGLRTPIYNIEDDAKNT